MEERSVKDMPLYVDREFEMPNILNVYIGYK